MMPKTYTIKIETPEEYEALVNALLVKHDQLILSATELADIARETRKHEELNDATGDILVKVSSIYATAAFTMKAIESLGKQYADSAKPDPEEDPFE